MRDQGRLVAQVLVSIFSILLPGLALAPELPDSELNAISGFIEITDTALDGPDYDVWHMINPGEGEGLVVTQLTTNAIDDLAPRIAISPNGDTWVTWWRDSATRQVLIRKRTYSSGSWSGETLVSEASETSRHPEVVHDGTKPWVAYEFAQAEGTSIAVRRVIDDPDPFPTRTVLATTTYNGDLDVLIHTEPNNLWITWVDDTTFVGWCEYNYATGTWSAPSYESYTSDSISAARERISTTVLGN